MAYNFMNKSFTYILLTSIHIQYTCIFRIDMKTLQLYVIMDIIIHISFILGSETLNMVLSMVLGNVAFCGPVITLFLDNTIPGMKINQIIL